MLWRKGVRHLLSSFNTKTILFLDLSPCIGSNSSAWVSLVSYEAYGLIWLGKERLGDKRENPREDFAITLGKDNYVCSDLIWVGQNAWWVHQLFDPPWKCLEMGSAKCVIGFLVVVLPAISSRNISCCMPTVLQLTLAWTEEIFLFLHRKLSTGKLSLKQIYECMAKPLQYCKVISLQLQYIYGKNKERKKKKKQRYAKSRSQCPALYDYIIV